MIFHLFALIRKEVFCGIIIYFSQWGEENRNPPNGTRCRYMSGEVDGGHKCEIYSTQRTGEARLRGALSELVDAQRLQGRLGVF